MKSLFLLSLFIFSISTANAKEPDCSGPERWPASMAFTHLRNAGITSNDQLDFTKTKVTKLASEKLKKDLYRQVHQVSFLEKSGKEINVITINNATSDECSGGDVDVYVISRKIDGSKAP